MPELPEVEVIRQGLLPFVGEKIKAVEVREARLRRRVSVAGLRRLVGDRIGNVERRAKYLLISTRSGGGLLVHLGMSGQLLVRRPGAPLDNHDHVRWWLDGVELRFRDPRRFGLVVSTSSPLREHPLLARLGPEPFGPEFAEDYLCDRTRGSRRPVKNALMDSSFVAGVGNIYASEALWLAGVNPRRRAGRISRDRWRGIRDAVREVLRDAIEAGGTTLNDFRDATGNPGYFQVRLSVYDRAGGVCVRCRSQIRKIVQVGRATYYCARCQT